MIRILCFGDVVGRSGRTLLKDRLAGLRKTFQADAVIVNAENASSGFGLSPKHALELLEAGADVLSLGNHSWDQKELRTYLQENPRCPVIRPLNEIFPQKPVGEGFYRFKTARGHKIGVGLVVGQVLMAKASLWSSPFRALDGLLGLYGIDSSAAERLDALVIDAHAEATSEKNALGVYLDGRVSAVFGTHTHIPTADGRILKKGTAYITDIGMCGCYDSVIGMEPKSPLQRFLGYQAPRFTPQKGPAALRGFLAAIDETSGLCLRTESLHIGEAFSTAVPVS